MVQFEKADSYQGIALAMPPKGRETLTASAAGVRPAMAAAAKSRGVCCLLVWHASRHAPIRFFFSISITTLMIGPS